ncbi:MAG: glucosidase [Chlamydiia bacterium]|nr:glucosidase [Chlamydiia bacterium]
MGGGKSVNPEKERLAGGAAPNYGYIPSANCLECWEKWGPYVSDRGWGTVREDYSADGDAWNYFTHDQARLRAFRRSEDGIAGISDRFQRLLFAPAFWNGKDPILKERLFGLNSYEGNHGEDVKEIYYPVDATPTHSYLKYLYKYPQNIYPYDQIVSENGKRGIDDREYELIDTGIFDEDRYFDIVIEYAKKDSEDLCIRIEAINRGPEGAPLHILPHLWFRNSWSWGEMRDPSPEIQMGKGLCLIADDAKLNSPRNLLFDYHLGLHYLYGEEGAEPLFTNNETNQEALFGRPNATPYVKDAFHRYLIHKESGAINPKRQGTKAALHYFFPDIGVGQSAVVRLRLTLHAMLEPLAEVDAVIAERKREADLFYAEIHPLKATAEEKAIQRQALSGMIWNKQIYLYDVGAWLQGDDPKNPPPEGRKQIRNTHWRHITSTHIFSMPDKWEYPWFAAWDLTFHSLSFALIDLEFAKQQLWMLLFDQFQHPNGAIPAYEWEFSDANPPVQAWAVLKLFEYEKTKFGREDYAYLEKCFHKLLLNFSWWINKVDALGNNVFEGGFLGMDNIGFCDRSQKLPPGYLLDQADGSGWISLLCLNMMRISLLLAKKNSTYEGLAIKFLRHFVFVTAAMRKGYWRHYDMWCEQDGFFYSTLRYPDGYYEQIRVRSLTGIIPFFACDVWDEEELKAFPEFFAAYQWLLQKRSSLTDKCIQKVTHETCSKRLFGLLDKNELQRFLAYLWNGQEFLSKYGLRSLSKYHKNHPAKLHDQFLFYEPGEAREKIKGGNSNWRGPIWFPMNYFLIDALDKLGDAFGDTLSIHVPGEKAVTPAEMALSYTERLLSLFKKDSDGRRPLFGDTEKFQRDPHFKDHLFFYEHFHGDTGRGLGASHQNGWTGLIANLIDRLRK